MDMTEEQIEKAIKVTEYFFDKYGEKNARFIMSRIATAVKNYDFGTMIELGEKIALFNGWTNSQTVDSIMQANRKGKN